MITLNNFRDFFIRPVVLVHVPKCGGTYIDKQYDIQNNSKIWGIGHSNVRAFIEQQYENRKHRKILDIKRLSMRNLFPKTKIIGLIREATDWYASYYYFCKQSLSAAAQSPINFPTNHPVSVFSQNAEISLEKMIFNRADAAFLENILKTDIQANVYASTHSDMFAFMQRTASGFWTWTMIHHLSKKNTTDFRTKNEVIQEAKKIANDVDFIHQESIDIDVEKCLKIPQKKGERANVSSRPAGWEFNAQMQSVIKDLDGEVAHILGGYC